MKINLKNREKLTAVIHMQLTDDYMERVERNMSRF